MGNLTTGKFLILVILVATTVGIYRGQGDTIKRYETEIKDLKTKIEKLEGEVKAGDGIILLENLGSLGLNIQMLSLMEAGDVVLDERTEKAMRKRIVGDIAFMLKVISDYSLSVYGEFPEKLGKSFESITGNIQSDNVRKALIELSQVYPLLEKFVKGKELVEMTNK
jgi:hypothetical protein